MDCTQLGNTIHFIAPILKKSYKRTRSIEYCKGHLDQPLLKTALPRIPDAAG